jgi:hypothetical protein
MLNIASLSAICGDHTRVTATAARGRVQSAQRGSFPQGQALAAHGRPWVVHFGPARATIPADRYSDLTALSHATGPVPLSHPTIPPFLILCHATTTTACHLSRSPSALGLLARHACAKPQTLACAIPVDAHCPLNIHPHRNPRAAALAVNSFASRSCPYAPNACRPSSDSSWPSSWSSLDRAKSLPFPMRAAETRHIFRAGYHSVITYYC